MKVAFGEIGRQKSRHTIQEGSWLPDGEAAVASPLTAEVSLQLTGVEQVTLEGTLRGDVLQECARCGDTVVYKLDENFLYLVTTRKEEILELQEHECSDEECNTLYLQEPVIDVAEILQEQFHLALPGKVVCSDDCQGLCPECGGSLNRNECTCTGPHSDSPFAVLKRLKKD